MFAAKYGAWQEDLDKLVQAAKTYGLRIIDASIPARTVVLSGTVKEMDEAFAVSLKNYASDHGNYRGHEGPIHIPSSLVDVVTAVFGLDNRKGGGRNSVGDPAGTTPLLAGPPQVAQLYNFPTPSDASGQIIGVIEFSGVLPSAAGWNQQDIDANLALFGVASTIPIDVPVTGMNNPGVNSDADGEVTLDICVAASVAVGATIRVYWGSDQTSGQDWISVLSAIINESPENLPHCVTNSWVLASGDDQISQSQGSALSEKFSDLATMGVTVFCACGDDGSRAGVRDGKAHVQYPGSDPWVTSCGGTTISTSPSFVEWVWNDFSPNDNTMPQATGGGVSALFTGALPPWQQVVNVPPSLNDDETIGRGVPDVAGNASLNSGYPLTVDGSPNGTYCGTSAVAPLYAGLVALITKRLAARIGFLNPTLYAFRATVCRDINDRIFTGSPQDNGVPEYNNENTGQSFPAVKGYPSGPGWDACTGLGVIDGNALLAALQTVSSKDCEFILDRTEFGEAEVAGTLSNTPSGVIPNSFYIVVDGFSASDLHIQLSDLTGTPTVSPAFIAIPGMSITATALLAEDTSLPPTPQRFTWVCAATFSSDLIAFTSAPLPRTVQLTASIASVSATATIELAPNADPYELDGPTSWLSTDLRVFQMQTNGSLAGLSDVKLSDTGMPRTDAPNFIQAVIAGFNGNTTAPPNHPFDQISTDEQVSEVTLNSTDPVTGLTVYNFAVARVRYRSPVPSSKVRVFFRLYQAATTSTAYEPQTYAAVSNASVSLSGLIPVLGVDGGNNIIAIPCFAEARVPAGTPLNTQQDDMNVLLNGIPPASSDGVAYAYFGCWLDINQSIAVSPVPISPVPPISSSPWANGSQSVMQALRGQHQCLIAEISYDADSVAVGQTPASSDKLAQRNLMIVPSANPGNPASHRIPQTFDVRPTPIGLPDGSKFDELMIDWGNTPAGSTATLYFPGVRAAVLLALAAKMYTTHKLTRVDNHTLRCSAGGVTWIPVPMGDAANFAGLLTVDLPASVRKGQVYTIVMRQVTDSTATEQNAPVKTTGRASGLTPKAAALIRERRVLGAFQLTIPVSPEPALLRPEEQLLAIMRWINKGIGASDRWSPVFDRYLAQIADRVEGFGGDPRKIAPSPKGAPGKPKPISHPIANEFTGKVIGLIYDQFGDFEAFLLETEQHHRLTIRSREFAVERVIDRAWGERILVTVMVTADDHRHLVSIMLCAPPVH